MNKQLIRGYLNKELLHEINDELKGKFVKIVIEEVNLEGIQEKRINEFIQRYEDAFGEKPKLTTKMSNEEKLNSGEYTFSYNVYGVKSKFL
ncbi:hypothetical protein QH639_18035 [Lysinibacillus sp. 1 U-2021]|uniref:hypothetical protein n=1 Tax=Lysinibacillus sp. 1 U-2021 TaxID=3039426 RepID=UPI00247FDA2D|nr:hypothetical protein [Lysinibacillus sp. 1 U-2021]WGT37719.1 hypothetical protein QH639_18035 [Lysinibacillus sp. 1 U-2021]